MKKSIFALSMLSAAGLSAGGNAGCEPCEPCCVPKPKKCIDCECYSPQFYDLQCDWGLALDVEFLYWYARESNTPYAATGTAVLTTTDSQLETTVFLIDSYSGLSAKWDPGVRIGIGWNDDCDGWDWNLNWTWYKNTSSDSSSVPSGYGLDVDAFFPLAGQSAIITPWDRGAFVQAGAEEEAPGLTFDKASADWKMTFNQIDLEVARKYWLSKCMNIRPFLGLRGAWTDTDLDNTATRNTSSENLRFKKDFSNCEWGVGFIAGFDPTWYFSDCFALYGEVGTALLWGKVKSKESNSYTYSTFDGSGTETAVFDVSNSPSYTRSVMHAMLDLGIGLRWEETWCCDRYMTALDLGWEHHIWFDHNHRIYTAAFDGTSVVVAQQLNQIQQLPGTFTEPAGNLGLGGFVLRLRFDF